MDESAIKSKSEKLSAFMKARWQDPVYREVQLAKTFLNPEVQRRSAEGARHRRLTPEGLRGYDCNRKLTDEQVLDIRTRLNTGERLHSIHLDYPWVSQACLSFIKSRKTYRHVVVET